MSRTDLILTLPACRLLRYEVVRACDSTPTLLYDLSLQESSSIQDYPAFVLKDLINLYSRKTTGPFSARSFKGITEPALLSF